MENFDSLIHQKDGLYCLNDIAEKLIGSKNVKEYVIRIKDKTYIEGKYYLTKDKALDLLSKSKSNTANKCFELYEKSKFSNKKAKVTEKIKKLLKKNTRVQGG